MNIALISLGANVASPGHSLTETLAQALEILADVEGISLTRRSRWFQTPAFPPGSGPDFVNGAVVAEVTLTPDALLRELHRVESTLGRERPARWAPRVCDLDLIAVDDLLLPDAQTLQRWMKIDLGKAQSVVPPRLILPHPRLHERAFVLAPLADIAPDWCHPLTGQSVAEMLLALPEDERREMVVVDDPAP